MGGRQICGAWGGLAVNASLMVTQMGVCIAYIIFISDNVADVVCHATLGGACPSREHICFGLICWLLPFCMLRSLNLLAVPMLLSNVAILAVVGWVFYCASDRLEKEGFGRDIVPVNWSGLPVFFGCVVFAFEGIGLIMPIQASMQDPKALPGILRLGMLFLCILYTTFGVVCYVCYGKITQAMVTFNIVQSKITSFLRLFYCFAISFSYPVMVFPVFGLVESRFRRLRRPDCCLLRVLLRSGIVFLTAGIAMNVPNFGLFLGLVGSLAASMLAFVLPALFHLKGAKQGKLTRREKVIDVLVVLMGLVAGCIPFTLTLRELMATLSSDEE